MTASSSHVEVARRAYELYLARGAGHGLDLQDWLQAERQLTANETRPAKKPASSSATHRPRRRDAR